MKTPITRRLFCTGAAFVATLALAAGALSVTPAQAATVTKQLSLTATPQKTSVAAFADAKIDVSWTGCYLRAIEAQELSGGTWKTVGDGDFYVTAGQDVDTCANATTKATVSLAEILGYYYQNQKKSLSIGTHTYRLTAESWFQKMSDGTWWDIADGVSNQFQITVTKAKTTFSGWTKKTITVKPGATFTLPAFSITNPGGYNNLVIPEINEGFGWVCLSSNNKCDSSSNKVSYNSKLSWNSRKVDPGKNWTLQTQFRYRVLSNTYVTGATSPVITVKFTKGISKSKATKTTLKVSGTQQYKKKQATLTATVNSTKVTGVIGFLIYQKSAKYGSYEKIFTPTTGPVPKKGKATYKFSKTVAKAGKYVVIANFQSKAPTKYRDSVSKAVSFTIKAA